MNKSVTKFLRKNKKLNKIKLLTQYKAIIEARKYSNSNAIVNSKKTYKSLY